MHPHRYPASRPEEVIPTRVRAIGSIKKKGAVNGATVKKGRGVEERVREERWEGTKSR